MRVASVLVFASVLGACGGETTPIDPPPTPPAALALTTASLADGRLRQPYTQALLATGGTNPYTFAISAGAAPAGIALTGANLGGTPTAPGRAALTITVTDAKGATASKAFTLYVQPDALIVDTSSLASGQESETYAASLEGSGGIEPYRWSITAGALPAGLTLAQDGAITGEPSTAGATAFTVQMQDAEDKTATRELMLTVRPLLPMITTTTLTRAVRGAEFTAEIEVESGHAPYTWSVPMGMLPRGISLDNMGRLSGRPTVSGVYRFTVRVTDARMRTDEAEFAIAVLAPLAITTRTLPNVLLNRPYAVQLEASGGARPYRWDLSMGTLPMGLTIDGDGLISGVTAVPGDFPITARVADDAGGVRQVQYTLRVADVVVFTSTPALAFPPVCSVPGNPTRCVPWVQNGMVCTSTQVSYQTVEIPVDDSFAVESLTVGVDLDYSDQGASYNSGNAAQNRNTRLRLLLTGPDGRSATLCGNDNGHRQMTGCYAGQNDPNSVGGVNTTYPDPSAPVSTPLSVFNQTNARGVWRFQVSVAWPTTDQNGNCHQAGVINAVTLTFRVDRSRDPYVTLGGFTYNNLIHDPWVRIAGGNQVADNNTIQLVATYWEVGPNGFREGGQGDDVPSSMPFTFSASGLPQGTTVTPTGFITGGSETGDATLSADDGAGHTFQRRLLVIPPDWNRKFRDF